MTDSTSDPGNDATRSVEIVESRLLQFEQDCVKNEQKPLQEYLPDDKSLRRAALIELIKIDLRRQWTAGKRPTLRDYCHWHPELGPPEELPADLVYEACLIAQRCETAFDLAEFPSQALAARSLLRHNAEKDATNAGGVSLVSPAGTDPTMDLTVNMEDDEARFRFLRPHAKGGLGEVFVAMDNELGREVAVKQIQHSQAGSQGNRERFEMEARVTGGLEHPGIVPVYGMGRRPDGRPFYAMRLIRGDSLKQAANNYFKQKDSTTGETSNIEFRQLLGSFIDACNAVAYAHSRGVLHRDLKPANIMLGKFGETLVVDWGLAKVVGQSEPADVTDEPPMSSSGSAKTHMGSAIGTPAFMSPEQATGRLDRISQASDVYGLGATLFYLLTGKPPLEANNVGELLQQVSRGEVRPPSEVRADVPKPLQAIALKAMATRPEDRYATPRELALDVERWLADEPVQAYPEPATQRIARWGRRRRALVASILVGLITVSVALTALTAQQMKANSDLRASKTALESKGQELEQSNDELELKRQALEDSNGELETKSAALETSNAELEQQRAAAASQRDQALQNLAKARQAIDNSLITLGSSTLLDTPGLQPLRRQLIDQGVAYYLDLIQDYENDPELRFEAASNYVRLGGIVRDIGTSGEALRYYENSLAILRELVAAEPDNAEFDLELATNLNDMALTLGESGQPETAIEMFQESIEAYDRLAMTRDDPNLRQDLASALSNLGDVYYYQQAEDAAALEASNRAWDIRKQLVVDFPESSKYKNALARSVAFFSIVHLHLGEYDESARLKKECLELFDEMIAADPEVADYRFRQGKELANLAQLYRRMDRSADAITAAEDSVRILKEIAAENPAVVPYTISVAASYNTLSDLEFDSQQPEESLASATEAESILRPLVEKYPTVVDYQYHLAKSYANIGRAEGEAQHYPQALEAYSQAVTLLEEPSPTFADQYNIACYRARSLFMMSQDAESHSQEERDDMGSRALSALRLAIEGGFRDFEHIRRDPDLESLRALNAFEELLQEFSDG